MQCPSASHRMKMYECNDTCSANTKNTWRWENPLACKCQSSIEGFAAAHLTSNESSDKNDGKSAYTYGNCHLDQKLFAMRCCRGVGFYSIFGRTNELHASACMCMTEIQQINAIYKFSLMHHQPLNLPYIH